MSQMALTFQSWHMGGRVEETFQQEEGSNGGPIDVALWDPPPAPQLQGYFHPPFTNKAFNNHCLHKTNMETNGSSWRGLASEVCLRPDLLDCHEKRLWRRQPLPINRIKGSPRGVEY